MPTIPPLAGLNWAKIRQIADDLAATEPPADLIALADTLLPSEVIPERMLATFLLGFTCAANPAHLATLREHVVPDPSGEVQEALAQAFDRSCATAGYEAALPTIDAWLAGDHTNARRAVTEGLRVWTSRQRPYFARRPEEAIRRLAALRADPSPYVRHSVGNALRDIRRRHAPQVDAETCTWNLDDPAVAYTYRRVLQAV